MAASISPSGRKPQRGTPQNEVAMVQSARKPPLILTRVINLLTQYPFTLGLGIRLVVMIALPALLDDGLLLRGVRYTDIDYDVFIDAADHAAAGQSPFERHTYRYTPFLAALLAWPTKLVKVRSEVRNLPPLLTWWMEKRYFGRLLFCVADAICGYIILSLRRKRRREEAAEGEVRQWAFGGAADALRNPQLHDALWWLYNPLPINICTRGSAESFVVLLPVLVTVVIATKRVGKGRGRGEVIFRAWLAGLVHGVAIHAKLYPIIYTISFMASFSLQEQRATSVTGARHVAGESNLASSASTYDNWTSTLPAREETRSVGNTHSLSASTPDDYPFPWTEPRRLLRLITLWVHRIFLVPSSIIFLLCSIVTFSSLTYLAVHCYGREALDEGFLYHLSRVDHRHNYSMHWYWIYLARGRIARTLVAKTSATSAASSSMAVLGRVLLLPQAILLIYASLGVAPYDLPLALFVQTFLFVAQNKVITAQYFTWYLCLLPLCSEGVAWGSRRIGWALTFLGTSVVIWLGSAYCLEMKGMAVHLLVWSASVLFFAANVNLLGAILSSYEIGREKSFSKSDIRTRLTRVTATKKQS